MILSFLDDVNSLDCYTDYLSIFRWWSHQFNPLSYCDVTPPPLPLRRTPRLLLLFRIPFIGKWYLFYIPSLKLCIPSKWNVLFFFLNMNTSLNHQILLNFSQPEHASVSPQSRSLYWLKWQRSLSFYTLQLVKSILFFIPVTWKRYPFREESPSIGRSEPIAQKHLTGKPSGE